MFEKNNDCHFWGLSALNMQKHFWFMLSFDYVNFAINGIPKNLWQSKLLHFPFDLSNIQKCSFKECPLIWVVPLIVILPYGENISRLESILFCNIVVPNGHLFTSWYSYMIIAIFNFKVHSPYQKILTKILSHRCHFFILWFSWSLFSVYSQWSQVEHLNQ
jgi:hypothetical protein